MTPEEAEKTLTEAISKRQAMTAEEKDAEWRGIKALREDMNAAWSGGGQYRGADAGNVTRRKNRKAFENNARTPPA